MAKRGDVLTNATGEQLIFRQTAAETNGALLEMEAHYHPQSSRPPEHYHPSQEEHFTVLAGSFLVSIDNVPKTYDVGDTFVVPAGSPHWMHNISQEQGRLNWQTRPAMDTEIFFETLWGLAKDGRTNQKGVPNLLQVAVLFQAFDHVFRLTKPPYWLQKLLFATLAPIGRLLGYRARYEKYSGTQ